MMYAVLVKHGEKKYRFAFSDPILSRGYFEHNKAQNIRCALLECESGSDIREDWTILESFCPSVKGEIVNDSEFDDYCDPEGKRNWWYL